MSSYRKKRYPAKAKNETMKQPAEAEFANPGVERSIHTGRLTSGLPYQRPVNPKEVERLVREWDGRLLEPAVVSFRDGKFFVVDGQHRIAAMCRMNGGNGVMAACRVYTGLTYEQEAELCYRLDKAKKRLSLSQSTNVLVEAGSDKETLEIKRFYLGVKQEPWEDRRDHGNTGTGRGIPDAWGRRVLTDALPDAGDLEGGAGIPYGQPAFRDGAVCKDIRGRFYRPCFYYKVIQSGAGRDQPQGKGGLKHRQRGP